METGIQGATIMSSKQSTADVAPEYTLEELQAAYGLPPATAADLFVRFGPGKADLDALINAKLNREASKKK
jgi:hypothetical protein